MEVANDIQWNGDSYERLIERALERESWGNYNGNTNLGKRLLQEVTDKVKEVSLNLNLYSERDDDERLAPLSSSGYVLVYKKEYYNNIGGSKLVRLLIIDVRKSY